MQEKVQSVAQQWSEFANIAFAVGTDPNAEIRISFQEAGSWSALGTDALVEGWYPQSKPTMNFGWLTRASTDADYFALSCMNSAMRWAYSMSTRLQPREFNGTEKP